MPANNRATAHLTFLTCSWRSLPETPLARQLLALRPDVRGPCRLSLDALK